MIDVKTFFGFLALIMDKKIAVVATKQAEAQKVKAEFEARYNLVAFEDADIVVPLGGDGIMLHTLHQTMETGQAIFGIHFGSVGFLMNDHTEEDLLERLSKARESQLHPLKMTATDENGKTHEALAINDVALTRHTPQAAKLRIIIDGKTRLEELVCDGVLVSTPAGSTAYNLSAHGPILPIDAPLLALTPICAFRPRRWRGALLPENAQVCIETINSKRRPVTATADTISFSDICQLDIVQDKTHTLSVLFDSDHSLEERILREQFLP